MSFSWWLLATFCSECFLIISVNLTSPHAFAGPGFGASIRYLSGFSGRLSRWFELLQAADLSPSTAVQPCALNAIMKIPYITRPPSKIVEFRDGYVVGSYSGNVIQVLISEASGIEIREIVSCSLQNAPVTSLTAGHNLYSGFRNGEIAIGDRMSTALVAAFPTSLHVAGPNAYELLIIGTSQGSMTIYEPEKSAFLHNISIRSNADRLFDINSTCVTAIPSLGCICSSCADIIAVIDARIGRKTPCLELRLQHGTKQQTKSNTITALASLSWGGVLVGTNSSTIHLLDICSTHPEEIIDTALCHLGPIKELSVHENTLVSGSARRLTRHTLVGKEFISHSSMDLDSVLCGLCPSAAILSNRTVVKTPL